MEKQKILYQQARLHARGAAEMVLQMISASKGNRAFELTRLFLCLELTQTHAKYENFTFQRSLWYNEGAI